MHERSCHDLAVFVTLTYDDMHVPENGTLIKRDLQLFFMRLRKLHYPSKLRYFAVGEYGDTTARPHYHALIYGLDFPDKKRHSQNASGEVLYTSQTLTDTWGMGHCLIGSVSFKSAAYVARYCLKKVNGKKAESHYTYTNVTTGEIFRREPEFSLMSRRPGIGRLWYDKYRSDIFPRDRVVVNGKEAATPRFYRKILEQENPKLAKRLTYRRLHKASQHKADQTPERLAVRQEVKKSQMQLYKRTL